MRRFQKVAGALAYVLLATAVVIGSRRASSTRPMAPAPMPVEPAVLMGIVRDIDTRIPIADVSVRLNDAPPVGTDSNGTFEIPREFWSNPPHKVAANRRGYLPAVLTSSLTPGQLDTVKIFMTPASRPCCSLDGQWQVDLLLDSAGGEGALRQRPTRRQVIGSVVFSDTLPIEMDWPRPSDSMIRHSTGRYDVNLRPFFGRQLAPDVSTTTFGRVDETFYREALGDVFHGDSVDITFTPRITHGGLSLLGRIAGDSITGRWYQRAHCCGAVGRFILRRTNP